MLTCSLAGQEGQVRIVPGTRARQIYRRDEVTEPFACSYCLNETFADQIRSRELRFSGYDPDGTARMAELPGHPFYISTLFVPQSNSLPGKPHPLIVAYVEAAWRFNAADVIWF
jgi:CTP synthase (UTP-ammonia lyase)